MSRALENKVCLIAGNTGIGAESARLFGQEGARIVAVGRTAPAAAALGRDLDARQVDHLMLSEDLSVAGAAERIVAATLTRFGQLDVLFHVAGISGRKFGDGPLADCTDEGWDAVMNTNLRAMMQLNRACIRYWLTHQQPGVILNMGSVLGFSFAASHFNTVGYAAAKGAIIALSQHTAATYAQHRIRVNVIAPALVETPMSERATRDPAILAMIKQRQPLTGAPLAANDCARAALFFCSEASATITGTVLPVDAGWCVSG